MPTAEPDTLSRLLGTAPERRRRILGLALPIIGGMVSQNVLNLVDTAMVGGLGNSALAAVGLGGFLNFLTSAFILGLGAGVQAMASRRVGEGREGDTAVALNGGLVLALALAVPWSALLVWLAPDLFSLVTDDAAVVAQGTPYLRARLVAMVAMGCNFSFRGYWNAIDRSALYMRTLITMHAVNIVLNWVLIFGNLGAPRLGATGAGVASAVATFVGAGQYFVLGLSHARGAGFLRGLPDRGTLATMLRVSAPAGLQQFAFAAGMTVFLTLVGRVGTAEVAATKVVLDLLLVALLPSLGFGLAAASLVGQALGRGDHHDARRWGWDVVKMAVGVVTLLSLPGILVPGLVLGVFIEDPHTLEMAVWPLRIVGLLMGVDAVGMVLMNALAGAGDTRRTMLVSMALQWLVFLPGVFLVGPTLGLGLTAIWLCQVYYRVVQTGTFVRIWHRGDWAAVKV